MRSFNKTIRALHRDLGYFVIGLTLLYAITGIVLSGRGLGWLQKEYFAKTVIATNISQKEFKKQFIQTAKEGKIKQVFDEESVGTLKKHLRLKLVKDIDGSFHFKAWRTLKIKYNYTNGALEVSYKGFPPLVELFMDAHKANHESAWFYLAIIYSVILSFLAISSFWMLKGKKGFKQRGMYFMLAGFVVIAVFLYI